MNPRNIKLVEIALTEDVAYLPPREIEIKHDDHIAEFEFSVMDFSNPRENTYKYKLTNYEDDWVDLDTKHNLTFTNLPSGEYDLEILGANAKNVWATDPIKIHLKVLPAPWLSWWAYAIYMFLFLAIGILLRKGAEENRLRLKADELANNLYVTAERAMDSFQEQARTDQQLYKNLHNYYDNTSTWISELLAQQAEEIHDPGVLKRFAENQQRFQCLRIIEQNMKYKGAMLQSNFQEYVDALLVIHQSAYNLSELECALVNTCVETPIPAFIAAPLSIIANELVDNSFKHAFENPSELHFIKVHFEEIQGEPYWQLEVIDNGCGLPDSLDPNQPTTLGFSLIQKFTEELKGELSVIRRSGSHFKIRIPLPDVKTYDGW